MSKRYAVLLGVNTYNGGVSPFGDHGLRSPNTDADTWADLLHRLGTPWANIRLVRDAETETAQDALAWLVEKLREPESQGFLFFAGHGDLVAGAWESLYLADYAGDGPREKHHRGYTEDGVFYLGALHRHLLDVAPRATLFAVVDACRTGPAPREGHFPTLAQQWNHGDALLFTATDAGERSYERDFFGTWRGQLTWALTTLIDQWAKAEGNGVRYVQATFPELVARATALIAAISTDGQPQEPQVYGSDAAKHTAVLHMVGHGRGRIQSSPRPGHGHEFGPDINGIFKNAAGAQIGTLSTWPYQGIPGTFFAFPNGAPPTSLPWLKFEGTAGGTNPNMAPTQLATSNGWTTITTAPTNVLINAAGTIGLAITNGGLTWQWFYWTNAPSQQNPTVLPLTFTLTGVGNMLTSDGSKVLRTITDTLIAWDP